MVARSGIDSSRGPLQSVRGLHGSPAPCEKSGREMVLELVGLGVGSVNRNRKTALGAEREALLL